MKKELPTQAYLNSILEYRDGLLYWKVKPAIKTKIGEIAGTINKDGYSIVRINYELYKAHNIIWKMLTGNDPEFEIDHIKKSIPANNRIENLRDVTHQENIKNKSKHKNNTSGYTNIRIVKDKYQVYFISNKYYKTFSNLDEAIQHRNEKYIEFGYHSNHGLVVDESNIL